MKNVYQQRLFKKFIDINENRFHKIFFYIAGIQIFKWKPYLKNLTISILLSIYMRLSMWYWSYMKFISISILQKVYRYHFNKKIYRYWFCRELIDSIFKQNFSIPIIKWNSNRKFIDNHGTENFWKPF